MKLFHLSDLHIGKRVNEFSMIEDQKYILKRILDLAEEEKPEADPVRGGGPGVRRIYHKACRESDSCFYYQREP